jgi:hypothetical protein
MLEENFCAVFFNLPWYLHLYNGIEQAKNTGVSQDDDLLCEILRPVVGCGPDPQQ